MRGKTKLEQEMCLQLSASFYTLFTYAGAKKTYAIYEPEGYVISFAYLLLLFNTNNCFTKYSLQSVQMLNFVETAEHFPEKNEVSVYSRSNVGNIYKLFVR